MRKRSLSQFETEVRSLREDHARSNGVPIAFVHNEQGVFALDNPEFLNFGVSSRSNRNENVASKPKSSPFEDYSIEDAYQKNRRQFSQDPILVIKPLSEYSIPIDRIEEIIPPINDLPAELGKDTIKYSDCIDERPNPAPIPHFPFMRRFIQYTPAETETNAADHYTENRQAYLALALAEACQRGIEINLDFGADAVNVCVVS